MIGFYDFYHTVRDDEIDSQRHVHNLQYLRWTLGAAAAHSAALGWNADQSLASGFAWVVRSHEVTYRGAAFAGDQIVVRTWIKDVSPFASLRKYLICRPADRALLTRVSTRWVYVDIDLHQVVQIPPNVRAGMTVCHDNPPLPWE